MGGVVRGVAFERGRGRAGPAWVEEERVAPPKGKLRGSWGRSSGWALGPASGSVEAAVGWPAPDPARPLCARRPAATALPVEGGSGSSPFCR